jgi:16S rRNA G527 N7-methylase RsmG
MRIESLAEMPLAALGGTIEEVAGSAGEDTPSARPTVDVVTVRAVASLSSLALWSEGLVSSGGRLLAFKGSRLEGELNEWKRAPGPWRLEEITPVSPEIRLVALLRE